MVQARMGSRRFPGKMTQVLGRHRIIDWVLSRVSLARGLDKVVLVTSSATENTILKQIATEHAIPVFCGSEDDVLDRFSSAAREFAAVHVVRICADNPFVDAGEIDRLVSAY